MSLGVTYLFFVNYGDSGSTTWDGTSILVPLPSEMTYVSCSGATCSLIDNTVEWNLGNIVPGQSGTVTFTAYVNTCDTNTFSIQAEFDISSPATIFYTNTLNYTVACATNTPTNTPIPAPTATPTWTPTATSTPGCAYYFDNFSNSGTITNYDYFAGGTQDASTAAGTGFQITGGELLSTSAGSGGGLAIVDNSFFSHNITDYTVQASFNMASYQGGLGLFGIAFRTGANGSFYSFQWNGNAGNANGGVPDWEVEKNSGSPTVTYSYLASGTTSPGYTLGTWVQLEVVVTGNNFKCYVNFNNGAGYQLIYNVTDSTYTSGGVGIRTYGMQGSNQVQISNLSVNAIDCPPTFTPTVTPTPTITFTPTNTLTPTVTPTPTATLVPLHVWPNPFNPKYAVPVNGQPALKAYQVPLSASMSLYTLSGELVNQLAPDAAGYIYWYGTNQNGVPVSAGIYYYVIQNGNSTLLSGKIMVVRSP